LMPSEAISWGEKGAASMALMGHLLDQNRQIL
jgi:hypothetical protein